MELSIHSDEHFLRQALKEAEKAADEGEIPVGCVIVANKKVIARTYNQTERLNDVTAHAEMLAITSAQNYLGSKYLDECTMYVTLEPCSMCAGAIFWSKLSRIVIGARDPKRGFLAVSPKVLPGSVEVTMGLLKEECSTLITDFFGRLRKDSD